MRPTLVFELGFEAMRALWTQEEASYSGDHVSFGAAWAWPKPVQAHVPLMIGAGGGPKTFAWIAAHADGWMTTPREQEVTGKARALRDAWTGAGRPGRPEIAVLANARPSSEDLAAWDGAGVTEVIWGLPDKPAEEVVAFIGRHARRLGL